jgi:TonB family protein
MKHSVLTLTAVLLVSTIATSGLPAFGGSSSGDPSVDGILKIVEPRYNGISDGVSVVIEVQIAPDGTVEDTTVIGPAPIPFVTRWVEEAARQWLFEPSVGDARRRREVTFTLDSVKTDSPRGVRSRYESPLTLHVEYVVPTVWFIERVDGNIPIKNCDLHHEVMTVERLPIHYGLWGYSEDWERRLKKYWRARERKFPNAHLIKRMGDILDSETEAEVYVCASCLKARRAWIDSHPDDETEPY